MKSKDLKTPNPAHPHIQQYLPPTQVHHPGHLYNIFTIYHFLHPSLKQFLLVEGSTPPPQHIQASLTFLLNFILAKSDIVGSKDCPEILGFDTQVGLRFVCTQSWTLSISAKDKKP